jgi:hypothetical protein
LKVNNGLNDERILVSGAIGSIATLAAEFVSWIFLYFNIGKYSVFQLNSLIITGNRPSIPIGLIVNFVIGSILGALVYLMLRTWGHRFTIINSIACTLIMWFIWETVFTITIEGKLVPYRPMGSYYKHMICSLVHGSSMGLMLKQFIFSKV